MVIIRRAVGSPELRAFVREEQEAARAERAQVKEEAERRAAELHAARAQSKVELEKVKLQAKFKDIEMARQAEIRQRERDMEMVHEREMAMIHKEATAGNRGSVSEGDGIPKVIRNPPLPCFNENTDSIYAYFQCFERYAENQGWEENNHTGFLGILLMGHALEVYYRSPVYVASDYTLLKQSLLQWYSLTEGRFRKKFMRSQ